MDFTNNNHWLLTCYTVASAKTDGDDAPFRFAVSCAAFERL